MKYIMFFSDRTTVRTRMRWLLPILWAALSYQRQAKRKGYLERSSAGCAVPYAATRLFCRRANSALSVASPVASLSRAFSEPEYPSIAPPTAGIASDLRSPVGALLALLKTDHQVSLILFFNLSFRTFEQISFNSFC